MPAKYQRKMREKVKYYRIVRDDLGEVKEFNTKKELATFLNKSEDRINDYVYNTRQCNGWWIRPVY